jgi:YD repeat-containing protein
MQAQPLALSDERVRVQQTYDSMGGPYQVSNPYRPCASETKQNTTTLYDALNRPLTVTTADSSPTSMSYLDNQTTIKDPAGVTRSTVTDAAGRTVSVTEAGTLVTSYLYDALNDLTKVCQGAAFVNKVCQSGGQPRTFAYDSLARLTSATNPESGTTTYTYDNNGNLHTKTDANTNVTTLSYDALNRVTSKTYTFTSGYSTPNVTYCYDGKTQGACANAPSGSNDNLIGHPTLVSATLSGVPISSTSYGQYDTLGNVLQSTQITGRAYPFTYTYNLANAMLGMTLPSGRTLTWTYDSANRIATAAGTPPGGLGTTYASSMIYASQGAIKQFNLGNGLVEARSYDTYRQQLTGVSLGPNGSTLKLGFDYCTGTQPQTSCTNNNGNLQSQTISPLGVTQTYTYDSYNRLYTSGEGIAGDKRDKRHKWAQQALSFRDVFRSALDSADAAAGSPTLSDDQRSAAQAALGAYGTENDDNGVTVGIQRGHGGSTVLNDNDTISVKFGASIKGDFLTATVAHEGTHVDLAQAWLSGGEGSTGNINHYANEQAAWAVGASIAQALGMKNLHPYGGGSAYYVWNRGWKAADVQTLRSRGIANILNYMSLKPTDTDTYTSEHHHKE